MAPRVREHSDNAGEEAENQSFWLGCRAGLDLLSSSFISLIKSSSPPFHPKPPGSLYLQDHQYQSLKLTEGTVFAMAVINQDALKMFADIWGTWRETLFTGCTFRLWKWNLWAPPRGGHELPSYTQNTLEKKKNYQSSDWWFTKEIHVNIYFYQIFRLTSGSCT